MTKTIEQRFQKLDDISHVILRPGMYIGSIKTRDEDLYILSEEGKFFKRPVSVNPGFVKIFDEIISNAADEHRRNSKLNFIEVFANRDTGRITVKDNGGIPVVMHKDHNEWVPELIFSNLKAGSNFDDSEARLVAGTNGVGATLTNIFSTEFIIKTCDGKQQYEQTFTGNMRNRSNPKITKGTKGFTEISYIPDFPKFDMEGLDDDHIELLRKRCADLSACNPLLKVEFNGEKFSFNSFSGYCRLYTNDIFYEGSERWRIAVGSSNGSMQQVSFVNGCETKDGGTHVDFVTNQIVEAIRARLKKKHKIELRPGEIKNHMFMFVSADIVNSSFSSQTKEKLITDPRDFGSRHELSDKFLKLICESEMIQRILDWAQQKNLAEERKALRELNKQLSKEKVLKLIDAKGKNRETCSLSLFEGDCLDSREEILTFDENDGTKYTKLEDVIVGDVVISHENVLRQVTAVSSKIAKTLTLKTKLGELNLSPEHRMWVYDFHQDEFVFVKAKNLIKGRHKLIKNKLASIGSFLKILSVKMIDDQVGILTNEDAIISSLEHKFAVLDISDNTFKMILSKDLEPKKHFIVKNILPQTMKDLSPQDI